tara:strand:+ start:478 stop:723 length:246 start_codon:yes stop_codon:yes gene_type:complete
MKIVRVGHLVIMISLFIYLCSFIYFDVINYSILDSFRENLKRDIMNGAADIISYIGLILYCWRIPALYENAVLRMYKNREI